MSRFATDFKQVSIPNMFYTYGETATYYPHARTSTAVSLYVITIEADVDEQIDDDIPGRKNESRRRFTITDDPGTSTYSGVASPQMGDELEWGGQRWAVEQINAQHNCTIELHCVRRVYAERSVRDYRATV